MNDQAPQLDVDAALAWIRLLHRDTGGHVSVSAINSPRHRQPASLALPLDGQDTDDRFAVFMDEHDTANAWGLYVRQTSMAYVPERGRGTIAETLALPAFWMDGDTVSPAHKHQECEGGSACIHPSKEDHPHGTEGFERRHAGRKWPLPAGLAGLYEITEEAGYHPPTYVQESGNGFYLHWLLDEPVICEPSKAGREAQLSAQLHKQLEAAAARRKLHYGPLGDLPRVLRLPGTINRKPGTPGGAAMSRLIDGGTGRRYALAEIADMVDRAKARTEALAIKEQATTLPLFTTPAARPAPDPNRVKLVQENSPQNDFNRRADWLRDILIPAGWKLHSTPGIEIWITRPGKPVGEGHSAVINHNGSGNMHVFSSDAAPFEHDENYTKSMAWRVLRHGGETGDPGWVETNRDLRRMNYGDPLPPRDRPEPVVSLEPPGDDMWAIFNARPPADLEVHDGGEEAFWSARPVLAHIRAVALGQYAAPWATLGVVLAKVVAATMPVVQLPATVGGYGSLNLFVALVAKSGGGKGAAENAAKRCLDLDGQHRFVTHALGSGEGLAHMFMKRPKPTKETPDPDPYQYNATALVTIGEIDTLTALSGRQGSTLGGQLRQAAMGEQLGFFYVDKEKRMPVPEHAYRLALVAGVQPKRAAALLDESGGGTPQRFLWLPATTRLPDVIPETPEPLAWRPPDWPVAQVVHGMARMVIPLPQVAIDRTIELRRAHIQGEGDPLDGHANMVRLKVAAALAILDGRTAVDDEDWKLSETLMAVSARTRRGIVEELAADKREANLGQAEAEAVRTVVVTDRVEQRARASVAASVRNRLGKTEEEGWVSTSDLRRSVSGRVRDYFDPVVEGLVSDGSIERDESQSLSGKGFRYRLTRR